MILTGEANMRLDVYQEETAQIARYQSEILAEARKKLAAGEMLSHLEQNGILHALQVLVETLLARPNITPKSTLNNY